MRKILAMMLAAMMILTVFGGAMAATAINQNSNDLDSVTPFKFQHFKNGIGKGTCPVYSAPYSNAFRAANGKAAVATNSYIDLGGYSDQGWLLVRYETNKGNWRVGWIPPKYIKGVKTSMVPHFSAIRMTAPTELTVTDNNLDPYATSGQFATLEEGEEFLVIGRYNYYQYDLWYIQFEIDGQPACGFIFHDDLIENG